jgi:hypothetical protein
VLKLLFRKGFPDQYMDQHKLYVFEVILNDGTTRHAVADQTACDDNLHWKDTNTGAIIHENTVLGWRETYNCDAARQDIDEYFRDPVSIVAKDHLGNAFTRHINREPCPYCQKYFEAKSNPIPCASKTAG